ncbi:MAG: SIS domain-containing protein, partial [bacterium]|nr:SIS domain-containing protein [bacterium]
MQDNSPIALDSSGFIKNFLTESTHIIERLDVNQIEQAIRLLYDLKATKGRRFICGVGGSAANASHAVNDFRKIVGIEAYAPTDNVSELTARTNDEGWESIFSAWLAISNLNAKDMLLILSVGGGSYEKNVSTNLIA